MSEDTQQQLYRDVQIAIQLVFNASTADRRLAGAEWLQQIAAKILEDTKNEAEVKP